MMFREIIIKKRTIKGIKPFVYCPNKTIVKKKYEQKKEKTKEGISYQDYLKKEVKKNPLLVNYYNYKK